MHAYPENLAALVRSGWNKPLQGESLFDLPACGAPDALPQPAILQQLLSICYQASLLRDENRAVRFRLILREPSSLPRGDGPPDGLHVLQFAQPIDLSANELRRLAAAAAFERALVGARVSPRTQLEIWGVVHTGEQWLNAIEGSRHLFQALPAALVISVSGPGHLTVGRGSLAVARLLGGRLVTPAPSLLEIESRDPDTEALDQIVLAAHQRNRRSRGRRWAQVNPRLVNRIRRQVAVRILSATRRLQHGGTLLFLPPDLVRNPNRWRSLLKIKYALPPSEPRRRMFTLLIRLFDTLAAECGHRAGPNHEVTWHDYLTSTDAGVREADEAITETVRFVASLSAVDGAVVVGQPLELLGFGAEISGRLPAVESVARALDALGTQTEMESALNVGTRHRSAYRFCNALPGAVAAVVSQDGSMRIVKKIGTRVVYSEHLGTGVMNV